MKVAEIMTKEVATCAPGDGLSRAAQLMWDHRCGCLPVLDGAGAVVGLITDRDVCMAAFTQGRRLDDITVDTAMSRPALTCTPVANIEDAEDTMMAHAVRRLVVVDSAGQLAGLVSIDDVARRSAAWDGGGDIDAERIALTLGEIARRTTPGEEEGPDDAGAENQDASTAVASSLAALATLRDEIRVDINLAGKEVRDRWRRLETRLQAAETRARHVERGGARSLAGLLESAREFRSRFVKKRAARRRASSPRTKTAKTTKSRARAR
jgi:CBS domain-containing protein